MSTAVLFYGYNLGAPNDTGWSVRGDDSDFRSDTDFEPPWLVRAEEADEDYERAMGLEILRASGVSEGVARRPGAGDLLAARCGVQVLTYGHSNTLFYGLALAGTVYRADDWSPKCIAPTAQCASHEPLNTALEALGMKPAQLHPSWILAPEEF